MSSLRRTLVQFVQLAAQRLVEPGILLADIGERLLDEAYGLNKEKKVQGATQVKLVGVMRPGPKKSSRFFKSSCK